MHSAPDVLVQLQPELTGIRLGFNVSRVPIVTDMIVSTGDLAAVAAAADIGIDDKHLGDNLLFLLSPG